MRLTSQGYNTDLFGGVVAALEMTERVKWRRNKAQQKRNKVQHLINKKKKTFVVGKLNENIGKPKELWKSLKSLGLPSKKATPSSICLENNGTLSFDSKTNAEIF